MLTQMYSQETSTLRDFHPEFRVIENGAAPEVSYHYIELPETRLHYIKCGQGPPLVMVPATISRIENWLSLAQFVGQKFTTYFFELPGHGNSSAFSKPFTSELVAETVEAFIDRLGYESVSVMGFSFGGILTMKTLNRLQDRVERVILLAPAASKRALPFSKVHRWLINLLVRMLQNRMIRARFLGLIHSVHFAPLMAKFLRIFGNVESTVPLDQVFKKITATSIEVLAFQLNELLNHELPERETPFSQPCFFAMSVNDPLLDFETTMSVIEAQFETVFVERFYFCYHQPSEPFTFEGLNGNYSHFLDVIM